MHCPSCVAKNAATGAFAPGWRAPLPTPREGTMTLQTTIRFVVRPRLIGSIAVALVAPSPCLQAMLLMKKPHGTKFTR
jgi:hypothetical protein